MSSWIIDTPGGLSASQLNFVLSVHNSREPRFGMVVHPDDSAGAPHIRVFDEDAAHAIAEGLRLRGMPHVQAIPRN